MLHEQLQGKFPSTSTEVHWSSSSFLIKFLNPWWDRIPPKITTRSEMWKYTLSGSERLFWNRHFPISFQQLGWWNRRSVPEYVLNLQLIVYLDLYIFPQNVTFTVDIYSDLYFCPKFDASCSLIVCSRCSDASNLEFMFCCEATNSFIFTTLQVVGRSFQLFTPDTNQDHSQPMLEPYIQM